MKKKENKKVGGVALFNGIIFSSNDREVIAQRKNNDIVCSVTPYIKDKSIISKIPILRGIFGLGNQIGNSSTEFIKSSDEEEKASSKQTIIIYIGLIVFLITIPVIVSGFFSVHIRNIIQLIGILIEFCIYFLMLKNIHELDTVYMYHGAEHKAVNAYENLKLEDITIENIKKQSRFHKRCGGNLVTYFMVLTLLSVFIPVNNLVIKDILMILISILNIGLAYEIVELFSKLKKPLDIINYPATLIQLITTKEPTDDMLELAMYGVLAAVRDKNGVTISEYTKKYINDNLKNIEYDVQDIYTILEYITRLKRNELLLQKDTFLITINQEIKANKLLNKYFNEKYPLQYLTHKQYFYNEEYYVDENVLIPRADSEVLVEKAIEYINNENIKNVIDLCTGSGALGISITKNTDIENMTLIDISIGAINVAKRNINMNKAEQRTSVQISDLLQEKIKEIKESEEDKRVDMIVSNPPYIKTDVINTLQEEVKKEPHLALDGGMDGLEYYKKIIIQAKEVLKDNGILIFEIGYDQLKDLENIIKENKEYKLLESVKDYGGNDRVVICRFLGK